MSLHKLEGFVVDPSLGILAGVAGQKRAREDRRLFQSQWLATSSTLQATLLYEMLAYNPSNMNLFERYDSIALFLRA